MMRLASYDISALIILLILLFSIYLHRMTNGRVNRSFLLLVYSCVGTTCFEFAKMIWQPTDTISLGVEKALTYAFYLCRLINAVCYIIYLFSLTDMWHKIRKSFFHKAVLIIPACFDVCMMIMNEFTGCYFYYDDEMNYTRGDLNYLRHICLISLLVYGICFVYKYRVLFAKEKRIAVILMFPLILIGDLIQVRYPTLAVEMFTTTLALLIIIITIQRPDENMNPNFGVRNYQAYGSDLRRSFFNKKLIDIIFIHTYNYDSLLATLGENFTQELLKKSILPMRTICKKYHAHYDIYYMNRGCFSVVIDAFMSVDIDKVANELNHVFQHDEEISKSGLKVRNRICVVKCPQDAKDYTMVMAIYNIWMNQKENIIDKVDASWLVQQKDFEIRSRIDTIINEALENNCFEVYYQPIYSTKQKGFNSAEALLRLHTQEYGFISPEIFIPAAEKSGAIYKIGEFVFEEVCRFIKSVDMNALGLDYIEINLSVAQCMQANLANDLLEILHKYHVAPDKINLEITETAVVSSLDTMKDNLKTLSKEGITFSLDDYGTGFSNIQRIITMPLSIVKLDKSFIDELQNPNYQVIVTNTIKMLKQLDLKIVSEGVEGEKQLEFLGEQECDYIQGYYFSRPLPKKEFIAFIKKHVRMKE